MKNKKFNKKLKKMEQKIIKDYKWDEILVGVNRPQTLVNIGNPIRSTWNPIKAKSND